MKALILTPYLNGMPPERLTAGCDMTICADNSYELARELGIHPDVIIGDFDHASPGKALLPHGEHADVITVPCEKDDTDTMLCIKYALSKGADEIVIAGGIGGRLDHTVANIQSLAYAESHGASAIMADQRNAAMIISGKVCIPKTHGSYLSVFAYGGDCEGVSESGVKYPVSGVTLSADFPLGVSNEITADFAQVEVKKGRLLIVVSSKEQPKT